MEPDIRKCQEPLRRRQFSLLQLLSLIAVTGFVLGLCRWFGTQGVVWTVVIGGFALPLFWRPRRLFSWWLPLIWTSIAWMNFHYPGDEYGGFAAGSLAGLWIFLIIPQINDVKWALPFILLAGATTTGICGFVMDKLRVPSIAWLVLWLIAASSILAWAFYSFPSVERALAKNGSYAAYVLPAMNLGVYASTIVMVACTGLYRLASWGYSHRNPMR
jgi:hypothetical protein